MTTLVTLRRAAPEDADWLVELYGNDDVDPFLGPRQARDRDSLLAEIERSSAEPDAFGVVLIECDGERAGAMAFHRVNEANRIAHCGGLAVHPAFRGRRIADEAARQFQRYLLVDLDYHRIEMAVYGFNERSLVHAERAGWIREGVKRRAYLRHGEWQDAVQFALLREDLGE
ncbi:MAG TPA: GNAT family protein [Gaiellaceae bacterium]|nr:GNAT family protein [Gaiellaceae bacterium]